MNHAQELHEILQVTPAIAQSQPTRHTALRRASVGLSRRNIAKAKAHILNTSLQRLTDLCFELEARDGLPPLSWNVDGRTGRILIGVPMGGRAHSQYGLRRQERNVLRAILVDTGNSKGAPLYLYDHGSWYLNFYDYRTHEAAKQWLKENRISPQMWIHYLEQTL